MWNKKSQVVILRIMLAVIFFIVAMLLAAPSKEVFETTTNASNLDCTNSSISTSQNATCIVIDNGLFYLVSVLIALSLAMLTGNKSITGIFTSIFVFVLVVALIEPLKDIIILFRDSGHLDCGNAAASVGAKLACLVVDIWLFWFIALVFGILATLIFNKKCTFHGFRYN